MKQYQTIPIWHSSLHFTWKIIKSYCQKGGKPAWQMQYFLADTKPQLSNAMLNYIYWSLKEEWNVMHHQKVKPRLYQLPREKSDTALSQERQRYNSEFHWLQILPVNTFLLQMCQKAQIMLEQLKGLKTFYRICYSYTKKNKKKTL